MSGKYHQCETCESKDGPFVTDSRDITRCFECNGRWDKERHGLMPWTPEEAATIRVALSQIADDGDPDAVTVAQRKLATQILYRVDSVQ